MKRSAYSIDDCPITTRWSQEAVARGGLDLRLDLRYDDGHAGEPLLFSAARKLLSNVMRYAEATWVNVRLVETGDEIELVVKDDGRGFPPERLAERLADRHVGLASQRVRVEAAGGRMDVRSAPGEGTRVEIHLPAP